MKPTLSGIHVYPVKSCSVLSPVQARVELRGLAGDRRWMVVDVAGKFVTARKQPRMVLIRVEQAADSLVLAAPGMPDLNLRVAAQETRLAATVWDSTVMAMPATEEADDWISRYLGSSARFVHMDPDCQRMIDTGFARAGEEVSFADGFPMLLISQASLDGLNRRLAEPVGMLRFRPSLVVSGITDHEEDGWQSIRIGSVRFDVVKPCARCVLTTVDPARGEFDPSGEPLRTLIGYRRTDKGVMFGQNLIPRDTGTIRVGDNVEVIG